MAITALGTLTVWNLSPSIPRPKSIYPPLNISSLLASSSSPTHPEPVITTSALLPNGTPLLSLDSGATYSYDADLAAWTRVSETWWSRAETWDGRRGRNVAAVLGTGRGIVRTIEGAINEVVVNVQQQEAADANRPMETDADGAAEEGVSGRPKPDGPAAEPNGTPETYRIALSLGHLETRIKAAQSLDSPHEYRVFLLAYAKKLADEGLRSKAEELIRELLGPIYQCVPLCARALSPALITCFRRTANLARRKRTSGRRRCWAWRNASSCGMYFASWVSLAVLVL